MSLGEVRKYVGYRDIYEQVSPFFTFANDKNPYVVKTQWRNPEAGGAFLELNQTSRIFLRCVSCNAEKFSKEDWSKIVRDSREVPDGIDSYFCQSCEEKARATVSKYESVSLETEKIVSKIWNQSLYGPLRSS
jgi:hypothetical protein